MLEVKRLSARRAYFTINDVSLTVQDGEYFVLLGPTGAGKSVLLESIAGIKGINGGEIWIGGKNVTPLTIQERNIGFAHQKYALFRHLPVRGNISYGVQWRYESQKEIDDAIDQVIDLLSLHDLLDRAPHGLSGGESQRICLARAIAIRPDLLLLDEPLGSVDAESRESTERELKEMHDRLGLTTIHVTHDFQEAIALGDRIGVMIGGSILQIGTPDEVFRHPNSEAVARFLMTRNILDGEVQDGPDGQSTFCFDGKKLTADTALRGKRQASIRPESIEILVDAPEADVDNCLPGTITHISNRGAITYVWVDAPPEFTCLVLRPSLDRLGLKEGQGVHIKFDASALNIF